LAISAIEAVWPASIIPDLERNTRHRFSKDSRLLDAASFGRVFEKATRSRDKWFTVLCRKNNIATGRLGLAISKKQCRKATARNRLKRIIRESFRHHQDALEGLDIVVMNKAAAADECNGALVESLEKHWQQCHDKTGRQE
jgi:ribonuclease P protein component